jgi:UDP-N-acetylglucosamine acyltransferase
MSSSIHPTTIVDPDALLSENVSIGPYAIIERNVTIGPGSTVGAHAHLGAGTRLGTGVNVFPHAVLGLAPQDLKYAGEETTHEIGDHTTIREFATLNRGTVAHGKTQVGSHCLLMSYSHVAHDCTIGNHCILANSATLAGHVTVEDWANIGGLVPIHQFVKIGCHTMVGGGWRVPKDVPPYMIVAGDPLKPIDVNKIGLGRRGFSQETIENLKRAHRILFRSRKNMSEALDELDSLGDLGPEVAHLKEFIRTSQRGVTV